jgi:hypothetical protein
VRLEFVSICQLGGTSRWDCQLLFQNDPSGSEKATEEIMPVILWLLGVPLVVVIALMLTHVI